MTQTLHFGEWDAVVSYGTNGRGPAKGNPEPVGRALVAQLKDNQFLVTGYFCRVDFRPARTQQQRNSGNIVVGSGQTPAAEIDGKWQHRQFLRVEEGAYEDGAFKFLRILNGDQTDWGLNFSSEPEVLRVSLATVLRRISVYAKALSRCRTRCRIQLDYCSLSGADYRRQRLELNRTGETIVLEPYAPNILRVTLSLQREPALSTPGYGVVAGPDGAGWNASQTAQADVYRSPRMVVSVDREVPDDPPLQTMVDIGKYFNGSAPGTHITFRTPDGTKLLELTGWTQDELNHKSGTAALEHDRRPNDPPFYTVSATFASPDDEHYYGLGQNQEGFLDHRGHPVHCWADYTAPAGPSFCVPFLITNKGYGLLWDNASKTIIEPGFNERTRWVSEAGDRVSFFVIAGATADEIYSGYRLLTGPSAYAA